MLNLDNVTIISATSINSDKTLKAIEYSMGGIKFAAAKLLTSEDVSSENVEIVKIRKMNIEEYSRLIVFDLPQYVDTEYLLLIQYDGFVVNPGSWKKDFFDYDYIGAPWPPPTDSFSYRDPMGNIIRVGNGGFSFRSLKLCKVAKDLDLEWKSYYGYYNEDGFITCHNRAIYEEQGCTFAPLNVAKYFSHECYIPELAGITPFGFHGRCNPYCNLIN
jgi:hypothetical protein